MRLLTFFVLVAALAAQETKPTDQATAPAGAAAPAAAAKPADQTTPPAAAAPTAATPAAATPANTGEGWLEGSVEIGYRWVPNITGNYDAYRSVVNFGPGFRLLNADFTIRDPKKRLFDRLDVHATAWGDPYNTLRVDMQKQGWYRLTADYRNIAYFDFLPSYADPTLAQGTVLDQNSFDTEIRNTDVELDLLPNKWITPYLAFGRNTQFGRGITAFETDINQYPVASLYSDQTDNFRGGVRMELGHYHMTLEQGGTTFKDDQGASDVTPTSGSFIGPFLGQNLTLNSLSELYRVRGDSIYTRALLAANPFPWMSITGQLVYSQAHTDVNYTEASTGTFYLQRILQFYSAGQDVLTGDANMPHSSGNVTVEIRPFSRLRIVQYWMTDRFHNAAGALLAENLLVRGVPLTDSQLANDRLLLNYNQEEVDAYYDLTKTLTLRGGYRYEWGNTDVLAPILTGLPSEAANLSRNVGIAGFNYRLGQKFRVTASAEGSNSGAIYFRTSLQNYEKARIRASYDLMSTLRVAADFSLLNNSNPDPSVRLDFSSKVESASVFWTPNGAKWANLLVDYSRSAINSSILYLVPETLSPATSIYKENAHSFIAIAALKWFSFGGSLFISSGSRPTAYYQPLARVSIPINKHVQWNTEWRWYSMSETFFALENFQSNQVTTSLRFTR
ncbi:MAG TPA: hypothetical protein VK776_18290 [Bryobacteraceae bacterium]|nr:hypothetical protein [Bryobacteraceae bacterium]